MTNYIRVEVSILICIPTNRGKGELDWKWHLVSSQKTVNEHVEVLTTIEGKEHQQPRKKQTCIMSRSGLAVCRRKEDRDTEQHKNQLFPPFSEGDRMCERGLRSQRQTTPTIHHHKRPLYGPWVHQRQNSLTWEITGHFNSEWKLELLVKIL